MQLFLFGKLLIINVVAALVTDTAQNKAVFVNDGGSVTLECYISHAKLNLSTWRRGENTIYVGKTLDPKCSHNRFNLIGNLEIGEYFLEISNVTENELGSYTCETVNNSSAVLEKFTLYSRSTELYLKTSQQTVNSKYEDHTYSEHISQTTVTTIEIDVDGKFKPTSGITLNWTLVFSGLIGSCFLFVLVMSVRGAACIYRKYQSTRAPNEHSLVTQHHEHVHNTAETNSYEYVDENTMMHLNRETDDLDRTSAISTSYIEAFEDPTDLRHSYQSLIENSPIETPHQYMVINRPTPYTFLSGLVTSEDTMKLCRNSLDITRKRTSTDTYAIKRINSWPTGVDKVNKKKSETSIIKLLAWKTTESKKSFKRKNDVTDSLYVDMSSFCETNKDKNIRSTRHNMTYTEDTNASAIGRT